MRAKDIRLFRCPLCEGERKGDLVFKGTLLRDILQNGELHCTECYAKWPVRNGIPKLYREDLVGRSDRQLRTVYDSFCALHDPIVKYALPLMQFGTEKQLRSRYMSRLGISALTNRTDGRPLRILEVGVGTGVNMSLIRQGLPRGLNVEIWGLDLSHGMLRRSEQRAAGIGDTEVRLLLGDAHSLPFDDNTFDRVFHIGGINGFSQPKKALLEMSRVAEPGTPIVVVDEQLDSGKRQSLYNRFWFRLLTIYDNNPHCPSECLPTGAYDVIEEQITRFYYCLTFSVGV
ncbi:MAG: methyltransferase domain-containing protein [Proteobacteria bacterium]|nr:methyltransferase domain-containing protein [Pseudomonadota bacterium]